MRSSDSDACLFVWFIHGVVAIGLSGYRRDLVEFGYRYRGRVSSFGVMRPSFGGCLTSNKQPRSSCQKVLVSVVPPASAKPQGRATAWGQQSLVPMPLVRSSISSGTIPDLLNPPPHEIKTMYVIC